MAKSVPQKKAVNRYSNVETIIKDIKDLKIQGASAIAKSSILGVRQFLSDNTFTNVDSMLRELSAIKQRFFDSRPTEPALRNSLNFISKGVVLSDLATLRQDLISKCDLAFEHFKNSEAIIADLGARKIKNGMIVFTHCHSSSVVNILLEAKRRGINFEVINTETRPMFQGRKTAAELAKAGIKVTHIVDSAVRLALKKADIFLFGADAITSEGKVINKIGTELFVEVAQKYDVLTYSVTDSWKFDIDSLYGYEEKIEERDPKEVWPDAPAGVKVINVAFEKVSPNQISGIISELGVFSSQVFIEEFEKKYVPLFNKKGLF